MSKMILQLQEIVGRVFLLSAGLGCGSQSHCCAVGESCRLPPLRTGVEGAFPSHWGQMSMQEDAGRISDKAYQLLV